MTFKRILDLIITVIVALIILSIVLVGLKYAVGKTGLDFPAIDVLLVPQDWFTPTRVALTDPTTVHIEGTAALGWDPNDATREWVASGSTLVLTEVNDKVFPVPADGRVVVDYTFGSETSVSQAAGWRVVKILARDAEGSHAAAYVIVDMTRKVWLRRTGPLTWAELKME